MSFPGMPPLLNKLGNQVTTIKLLVADAQLILGLFVKTRRWGIFKDGEVAIEVDSVLSLEYNKGYNVADYPMEEGAFQTYNKVSQPYEARVEVVRTGNESKLQAFLTSLDVAAGSLKLYDVVTPEKTYKSANITRYEYHRTVEQGIDLIKAEVWLKEVRITVSPSFTDTATPSGNSESNGGTLQTFPLTPQERIIGTPIPPEL